MECQSTGNGLTTEAEGSQLLTFVTRERLMKTWQRKTIVESCYQATTGESSLRRERGVICDVEISYL
jgi:hypothetical protein